LLTGVLVDDIDLSAQRVDFDETDVPAGVRRLALIGPHNLNAGPGFAQFERYGQKGFGRFEALGEKNKVQFFVDGLGGFQLSYNFV